MIAFVLAPLLLINALFYLRDVRAVGEKPEGHATTLIMIAFGLFVGIGWILVLLDAPLLG